MVEYSFTKSTFSLLDWKYHFWANLVPTFKIVCLRWDMVPRLSRICKIKRWCLFFLLSTQNTLFCVNLVPKIKVSSLSQNLVPRLNELCRIQWWCSLFCYGLEISFLANFGEKVKSCQISLSWNLVGRRIRICRIQWWCSVILFSIGCVFFG